MLFVSETWTKVKEGSLSCQLTDFRSEGGGVLVLGVRAHLLI
jgi:hypothetical protein